MLAETLRQAPPPRPRGRLRRVGAAAAAITFLVVGSAAQARTAPEGFAGLAAKVTPAVVNISAVSPRVVASADSFESMFPDLPKDSPFYELFRGFERRMPRTQRAPALGSGFIIDPAGYIVTNNHVIDGAETITVTLHDGRKLNAKVVGRDQKTDLALLKVESDGNLPSVEFGDSDKARVGDWVVAVGNPFGLGGTVTAGIISARNRDIRSGPYDDYLQIDAPINKGNSGGPLFDMEGRVVGINTAIYTPNGGSIGIGFAIPASIAKPVIDQLRAHGRIERGWLGVSVQPVTDELAKALGLERPMGALVAQVMPNSPAARAGLKAGDVILSVGSKRVDQSRDLPRLIAAIKKESTIDLGIWRAKREQTLAVTIGTQPGTATPARSEVGAAGKLYYGLSLGRLASEQREMFDIPDGVDGVVIAQVAPRSPAAEAGLRAGDVILRIGDEPVTDPATATRKLEAAKASRQTVVLLVSRGGDTRFVALKARRI